MASVRAIDGICWARRDGSDGTAKTEHLRRLFDEIADDGLPAMTEIYDGWSDELFGFAVWVCGDRQEAAEIVQEVMLGLWQLRRRLGRVRHPRAYLLRMVRNAAADRHRKRPGPDAPLVESLLEPTSFDPTRTIAARRASAALLNLSAEQRTVIYLHLYAELTFREIGEVTGVSLHTAASRYRLGIERLRARLGEDS